MSAPQSRQGAGFALDLLQWLAALFVTAIGIFVYVNSAFFSNVSALHVDLSINLTAAHAIRDGEDPYGETVLLERAIELGSPAGELLYQTLFTSYIQPPTSALAVVPFTLLDWREATRAYLVLNNLLLVAAVVLTMYTVRPTIRWRWAIAGAAVIVAGFSQIYASFALGQVDATQTFLLAVGLWGYSRGHAPVTGAAIAVGVAIKLIPGILLLYFLWKREYRIVAWGVGIGAALFLASVPAAGVETYETYFTETVPGLVKGSTHYANVSIGGAYNRLFIKDLGIPLDPIMSLEEVPLKPAARALNAATIGAVVVLVALLVGRRPLRQLSGRGAVPQQAYVLEYYLFVTVGLMVSSVTWEFYVVWLLPLFLALFLAPGRLLPSEPGRRWLLLAAFALVYVALNYPGGRVGQEYLFDVNGFFYHPDWAPGAWVDERINLYRDHLAWPPTIRLAALSSLALILLATISGYRRSAAEAGEESSGRAASIRRDPQRSAKDSP